MEDRKLSPEEILAIAGQNQQKGWDIINKLNIFGTWEKSGAKAYLTGSLKSGLLMKNRDIDFHIYSDNFSIEDSFKAITEISKNPQIKRVTYDNLIETKEMCLEWHVWYEDDNKELWQIDMIHILNESPYAGKIEEVTDRIAEILTPEMKLTILTIKNDVPEGEKAPGIEIYRAVIEGGIKNYTEFKEWQAHLPPCAPLDWTP